MNNFDGIEEPVVVSSVGKKRKPSKENHEREVRKRVRNSGGGKKTAIACSHSESRNICHADKLAADDLVKNFDTLYCHTTKAEQDQAILRLITVKRVQRRRPKVAIEDAQKEREVTNEYYLLSKDHSTKVPVCKATFCAALGEFICFIS